MQNVDKLAKQLHENCGGLSDQVDGKADAQQEALNPGSETNSTLSRAFCSDKSSLMCFKLFTEVLSSIFLIDSETNLILDVNPAAIELTGYDKSELIGSRLDRLLPEDEKGRRKTLKSLASDSLDPAKLILLTKSGDRLFVDVTFSSYDCVGEAVVLLIANDVTELKSARESLTKTEQKLGVLFHKSPFGLIYCRAIRDAQGRLIDYRYLDANDAVYHHTGYDTESMIGKSARAFANSRQFDEKLKYYETMLSEQRSINFIHFCEDCDKTVDVTAFPIDKEYFVINFIDVTQQKSTEAELRKFKVFSEQAVHGNAITDLDGNLLYVNSSFAETHGFMPDELIGKNLSTLHTAEQMTEVRRINGRLIEAGSFGPEEVWHVDRDGVEFPMLVSGTAIHDENGAPQFLAISAIDFTERRRMEERLRDSEERYRRLFEKAGFGISVSRGLELVHANKKLLDIFKVDSADRFREKPPLSYFTAESRLIVEERMRMLGQGSELPASFSVDIIREDGEVRRLELDATNITLDGEVLRLTSYTDVTERHHAEEKLHESEEKFRGIFEQSPLAIQIYDLNGRLIEANQQTLDLFGIEDISYVLGYSLWDDPNMSPEMAEHLKQGTPVAISTSIDFDLMSEAGRFPTSRSGVAWLDIFVMTLRQKGKTAGYLAQIVDVTARKQVENELRKSKARLIEAQRIADLGDFVLDVKTGEVTWSEGMYDLMGYDKSEAMEVMKVDSETDQQDTHESFTQWLNMSLESGDLNDQSYEFRLKRKDARLIDVQVSLSTELSDGKPCKVIGTVQDITKRKQAEVSNTRLLRAIEQAEETIVITDVKGIIEYTNPAFTKTTGYSVEEVIGRSPRLLKSGMHDQEFYTRMWKTLSSGREWSGEIVNKRKDGTLYTENVTISPVVDSAGKIVNYVAAKNDITETKRLRELESRAERLETAGIIAGQVAHDFNNLLAPIAAYPEMIRDELPRIHPAHEYIDQIEEAAKGMAEINQQLLTLGRRGHYNQVVLNLNSIVSQAVKNIPHLTDTISVEVDLAPDLMNILGGGSQIHRVLTNLLCNAVDALDEVGHIIVSTENIYADDVFGVFGRIPKGEYVRLTVSDDGCGIPDDVVQKILDPFFTTKTSDKKRGSGLGMSVVDTVVKDHNGYLDLKTQPGIGTSFYIYFPITRLNSDTDETSDIPGGTETILVIDDDKIQRDVTTQLLQRLGYIVSSVESGEDAIEFLKHTPQDLIILDMVMPGGIDGAETFEKIVEFNPAQRSVIVSGYSESARVRVAQELGAGSFVRKPLTRRAIATVVRSELDKAEAARTR